MDLHEAKPNGELEIKDSVSISYEASVETIESLVKELQELRDYMEQSRKKSERNAWIRTFVGVIFGFVLGQATRFIGF